MFTVTANEAAINRAFDTLEKQLRFAAAQALTHTAQDAQVEVKRQLPERFTIRTNWLAKGIRIRPASKSTLSASVLVKDAFMALQETGGDKTSTSGSALGVPVGARPTPQSIIRPSNFPGAMASRKGYFIGVPRGWNVSVAYTATGRSRKNFWRSQEVKPGVWQRLGYKGRSGLKLMYVFEEKVRLKPRFGFRATVRKVAAERFPHRFAEALKKALATAR
ncbi:MAG: hypothetical protein HQL76_06150 [Magnetococcales bacterium]|nr:hypothetical protein [Magnetococcales bacterium]